MAQPFAIRIAGLTVEIHPRYELVQKYCGEYVLSVLPSDPDIVVISDPAFIAATRAKTSVSTDAQVEITSVYRQIAEELPRFNCCLFHGAAIEVGGRAYLFTAASGTGKSTHITLWKRRFGDKVRIINGDKPILRLSDTAVDVCSTPWAGKERWQRNCIVPLGGWCLLNRGETDRIVQVDPAAHAEELLRRIYLPQQPELLGRTLELFDRFCRMQPLYWLECTPTEHAAQVAYDTMIGGTPHEHS